MIRGPREEEDGHGRTRRGGEPDGNVQEGEMSSGDFGRTETKFADQSEPEPANPSQRVGPEAVSPSRRARKGIEFVYLVQHDSCLDLSHLESPRSAALLLCWRTPPGDSCPGALYFPNSSLVAGRNRLIAEGRRRFQHEDVRYWVMMDGDCQLVEVEDFGYNTGDAWETFEGYLLEWEPAVGFPHFGPLDYDPSKEVQLAFNFDQIVVAYHTEALQLLLPYSEIFDTVSWWYCASLQNLLCAVVYNDHRLQFNAVRALSWVNSKASSYKRAQNFLEPLSWLASSVVSLEALMTVPWFNGHQSALASRWLPPSASAAPHADHAEQAYDNNDNSDNSDQDEVAESRVGRWVSAGSPQPKGSVRYDDVDAWEHVLDLCHPYFEDRGVEQRCKAAEDGRASRAASAREKPDGGRDRDQTRGRESEFEFRVGRRRESVEHTARFVAEMIQGLLAMMGERGLDAPLHAQSVLSDEDGILERGGGRLQKEGGRLQKESRGPWAASKAAVASLGRGGQLRAQAERELGRLRAFQEVLALRLTQDSSG